MNDQNPRILIIDDDPNLLMTLSDIFKATGFEPVSAQTGIHGLAHLAGQPIGVALIDLRLEDMSGLEVLRSIKARSPETECILLTGYASQNSAIEAIQMGAYGYFQKPFDMEQVLLSIQRALEKRQSVLALRESEARYRTLTEQIPAIVYLEDATNETGHTLYISPQVETILGITPDEWLQDHLDVWANHIHIEDRTRVMAEYEKCFVSADSFDDEYRMIATDGRIVWIHDQAKVIQSENGRPRLIHGIMYDITERKRVEEALRRQFENLDSLYQMTAILSQTATVEEVYNAALDSLRHTLAADRTAILLFDVDKVVRFKAWRGLTEKYRKVAEGHSPWPPDAQDPQPVLVPDAFKEPSLATLRPAFSDEGIGALGFIPLTHQGCLLGKFMLYYDTPHAFSPEEIQLAQTIARHVAFAIGRKQAEEALRQRVANLETLNRISMSVRAATNPQEMLATILEETLTALNMAHGAIYLWNETSGHLHKMIARGWPDESTDPVCKPGQGILGKVFTSGKTYLTREIANDPWTEPETRQQLPPGWGGTCVPIHAPQQTLGVLFIAIPSNRELSKDEIRLLNTLTEMTGATLHRMRLHEDTVRHLNYLQALHTIDQAITASFDLRPILNTVLTNTITQLHVDAADVLLFSPRLQTLEYAAGTGFHAPHIRATRIRIGDDFAGRVATEGRMIHISNPMLDKEKSSFASLWATEGFRSYFGVPLIIKGEIKGVLELFHRAPLPSSPEWLDYLNSLALQTAIAIDNTQLFENLQQVNLELRVAYDATIEGWSRAMDLRDQETEGHTRRVTEMALSLAKSFGLNPDEMLHMHRGALLHDIGKIGVPDHILLKPGLLTEEETNRMRQHPQLAYQMLFPIAYLRQALDIPYCHHEKWDGTGYPRGLKGEQIPLTARIFAVVDVYDALTSDRPYRKAWPREKTLAYLREQSGSHFDPKVLEVFLKFLNTR